MSKTRVVHCKIEDFDVYIGRPSKWGNLFSHKAGTLAKYSCVSIEEAVEKYRAWILTQPELLKDLVELKGKTLGCWCKTKKNPQALCHDDVLAELAECLEEI